MNASKTCKDLYRILYPNIFKKFPILLKLRRSVNRKKYTNVRSEERNIQNIITKLVPGFVEKIMTEDKYADKIIQMMKRKHYTFNILFYNHHTINSIPIKKLFFALKKNSELEKVIKDEFKLHLLKKVGIRLNTRKSFYIYLKK
jgi:hypothetical protein